MINFELIASRIRSILKRYDVRRADVFRSSRTGDAIIKSIYLMVELGSNISLIEFMGIQHDLEDELGIKVGLFEYDALRSAVRNGAIKIERPIL